MQGAHGDSVHMLRHATAHAVCIVQGLGLHLAVVVSCGAVRPSCSSRRAGDLKPGGSAHALAQPLVRCLVMQAGGLQSAVLGSASISRGLEAQSNCPRLSVRTCLQRTVTCMSKLDDARAGDTLLRGCTKCDFELHQLTGQQGQQRCWGTAHLQGDLKSIPRHLQPIKALSWKLRPGSTHQLLPWYQRSSFALKSNWHSLHSESHESERVTLGRCKALTIALHNLYSEYIRREPPILHGARGQHASARPGRKA